MDNPTDAATAPACCTGTLAADPVLLEEDAYPTEFAPSDDDPAA